MTNQKHCSCQVFQSCPLCAVPKYPKPGRPLKRTMKTKRVKRNLIEQPVLKHCRRCGKTDGTEALRHLETFRKHELGKGIGTKCNNHATAYLCMNCDDILSNKRPSNADSLEYWIHAEEWLFLIFKTWLI